MQAHVACAPCAPCVPPERCCVSAESPTARFVETASRPKSGRAEYPDAALPGFRLRVTVDGKRSFSLRYRGPADRKHRRLTWPYPAFLLLEAREEAQATLRAIGEMKIPPLRTGPSNGFVQWALGLQRSAKPKKQQPRPQCLR